MSGGHDRGGDGGGLGGGGDNNRWSTAGGGGWAKMTASTATSKASFTVSIVYLGSAYTSLGTSLTTSSCILRTAAGGILLSVSSMLTVPARTSSSGMYTEYRVWSLGRCHVYWRYADAGWKNTGTHPATMASNADRRVYESPGGWRQKTELSNSRMMAAGVWHWLAPKAQPSCWHADDAAPHWAMICDRIDRWSPGRGAPTKDMSQGRSAFLNLCFQDVGVCPRVEVGRVRHRDVVAVAGSGRLDNEDGHVLGGLEEQEVGAPVRVEVGVAPEVPRRPPGHEEMVAAARPAPLGPAHEPARQVPGRGVPRRVVVAPVVPHEVEAGVERDEHGGRLGGVVGEAPVPPHAAVEDGVQRELVGGVPAARGREPDIIPLLLALGGGAQRLPEAGVAQLLAHVGPASIRVAAATEHFGVEPRRELVHIHVTSPAGNVVVATGALVAVARCRRHRVLHCHACKHQGRAEVEYPDPERRGDEEEEPRPANGAGLLHRSPWRAGNVLALASA
ncbi:LOW QUALITY PROTEIN: hypothetical protein BRADI_3g28030v3 [Brachypodium distachyon]|uniref:Uncharacterized protein n=1 Tax=Brachypodium distachyon TaxID=15368 RepID=A0A2K2CZP8_BRADI|nr:LOW QUALITY PROTEIN: hypothetical protein BRADI_3g28030v3 [Brachypodium distachyon]